MRGDKRWPASVYSRGDDPDPRFSLANERTLLAWLRTSLGLIATAAAVLVIAKDGGESWVLAGALVAATLGAILAPLAIRRWAAVERALRLGEPLPAPVLAFLVAAGLIVITAALVITVWVVR